MPDAPPKLLILTTDLRIGGTPTVVRELSLRLRARGHDVEVACLSGLHETGEAIRSAGVPVHALGAGSVRDLGVALRLRHLIQSRCYSRVFSLLVHANTAAALACRNLDGVRLYQSIQTTQPRPAWHWPVQRYAALSARRVIVPSASVADVARDRSGVPDEKLVVIPNAIEASRFSDVTPGDGVRGRLVFLGRLDPVKRLPDLLDALRLLPPHITLDVYGDGPERAAWQRLAAPLGPRVTFHGSAPATRALEHADLLVLPSEAEGFGLVVIEAFAARVPVVCSDAPGLRDVARDGRNALTFPVGDVAALARAILTGLTERTLRRFLAANALTHARTLYAWEPVLDSYERALDLPPLPRAPRA